MNHMEMSENMIRYANRITKPIGSGLSPADIALIILLACDSGRSSITCLKPLGNLRESITREVSPVEPETPSVATVQELSTAHKWPDDLVEFRMLGSSDSTACANIMLNAAVAESLKVYADRLEQADDFERALHEMIRKTIHDHRRIIFNGNGYDDAWIEEAVNERGLLNLRTTADAMPHLLDEKNVRMLTAHGVFTTEEIESRCEIMLENYCKTVTIEANTMVRMSRKQIMPAIEAYAGSLASTAAAKKAVVPDLDCAYESNLIVRLSQIIDEICSCGDELEAAVKRAADAGDIIAQAAAIRDDVLPRMDTLRAPVDEAEVMTKKDFWPYPSYGDLLFSVR